MPRSETTAAFKKFSCSARLEEPRFRYANDPRFQGFLKLLADMLPEAITPSEYCDLCEELLSFTALRGEKARREQEALVTRLVVFMQGCPPVTPKLFSDRFTNAAITLFGKRYLQRPR